MKRKKDDYERVKSEYENTKKDAENELSYGNNNKADLSGNTLLTCIYPSCPGKKNTSLHHQRMCLTHQYEEQGCASGTQ
eukprot:14326352-Ditylum_brightwellii.AAC.1